MAEVVVNGRDVSDALLAGMSRASALRRASKDFIDDAADTWREVWETTIKGVSATSADPHPYETGNYVEHIKKVKLTFMEKAFIRKALRDGVLIGRVYNDADDAIFIEGGTKRDKPGSKSPWGPNTPTPKFEIAKRTSEIMNSRFNVH